MTQPCRIIMLILVCLFADSALAAGPGAELHGGFINPGFHEKPEWFKNSFLDLREDVAEATAEGKRIMLFFYQDGCPYCARLLNVNFSQKALVEKTRQRFVVIALNIWGDREVTDLQGRTLTEKDLASNLKVMYTPTLIFLDPNGVNVLRLNGYYPPHQFEAALDYAAGLHDAQFTFRDHLHKVKPEPASGVLHRSPEQLPLPLDLSSREVSAKPLLVLMEQKECRSCDELHGDILRRPTIAASLEQFDVALVDVWSNDALTTPEGELLKAVDWAKRKQVYYTPSLLFFDRQGREVFRTDAMLKAFHVHAAMDYVLSEAYLEQPNFQRFIQTRADTMRAQGMEPDLMQ